MPRVSESRMFCTQCGKEVPSVWRIAGRGRKAGHLKKLWCFNCRKENNCVECIEFSHYDIQNFFEEFNDGNFNTDGTRKLEYKKFVQQKR